VRGDNILRESFKNQNQEIVFFGIFFADKRFIFFFEKDSRLGLRRLWLLIPLFAKNSRLGYFF
jgi:hypothetical protein